MSDLPDTQSDEFIEPPGPLDYRLPPSLEHHEDLTDARLQGYSWPQIDGQLQAQTADALGAGYSQQEIDDHLGYIEPLGLQTDLGRLWQQQFAADPELVSGLSGVPRSALAPLDGLSASRVADYAGLPAPPVDSTEPPDQPAPFDLFADGMRSRYADALLNGETKGPLDFAERYAGAFLGVAADLDPNMADHVSTVAHAARDLADTLPSNEELTDQAIGLATAGDVPLTPGMIAVIKDNLADLWSRDGTMPAEAARAANSDPAMLDALTSVKYTPPTLEDLSKPGRDAIEKFYFMPGEELADAKSVTGALTDLGIDVATYAGTELAGKYIVGPLVRAAMEKLGELPPLIADLARKTKLDVIDPMASPAEAVRQVPASEVYSPEAGALPRVAQDIGNTLNPDLAAKIERMQRLHEENFGPETIAGSGTFFQRRLAELTGEEPKAGAPEPTAQEIQQLAEGYQVARTLRATISSMLQDQTGAGLNPFRTAAQQADRTSWLSPPWREDRDAAAAMIREYRGAADRQLSQIFARLEPYRKAVNQHLPDFEEQVKLGPAGNPDNTLVGNLYNYMEGRSLGAVLRTDSPFAPVADELRSVYQDLASKINASGHGQAFYQDYVRHLWKDPQAADRVFLGNGRQGSGASLKQRSIPTISDGLAQGLEPKILDPIENTLHYVDGMVHHLAALDILDTGRSAGYIQYFPMGKGGPGWVPLSGHAAIKPAGTSGSILQAYAPPGYARVYNNWLNKGWYDSPIGATIYRGLLSTANAMTAAKLALSGYHAFNIGKEATAAGLTDALGAIPRGQLVDAMKQIGLSGTLIGKPIEAIARGAAIEKQFLGVKNYGPEMEKVVDVLTRAGMRMTGRSQMYRVGSKPTIFQSLRRGSLTRELKQDFTSIIGSSTEAPALRAAMLGPRVAGFFADEIGRVLDTTMVPLFDKAIPHIKNAAAFDEMESWMRANRTASREEVLKQARTIVDSVDDRFGEMNQDNLFWNQKVKQALNLATVSVGWEYGSLRAFARAGRDLATSKWNSPYARWAVAYPLTMGLMAAAYQGLRTGQGPQSIRDLLAPRTGGTAPNGDPERIIMPGYEKDAYQWYRAMFFSPDLIGAAQQIATMARNKLNPLWQAAVTTLATGTDAIGHSIRNMPNAPHIGIGDWELPKGFANYLRFWGEQFVPIPFQQAHLRGSGLSDVERFLGFRPAPKYVTDPEGYQAGLDKLESMRDKQELGRARRENSLLETPDADLGVPGGRSRGTGGQRQPRSVPAYQRTLDSLQGGQRSSRRPDDFRQTLGQLDREAYGNEPRATRQGDLMREFMRQQDAASLSRILQGRPSRSRRNRRLIVPQ